MEARALPDDIARIPYEHWPSPSELRLRQAFDEGHDADVAPNIDHPSITGNPSSSYRPSGVEHSPTDYQSSYADQKSNAHPSSSHSSNPNASSSANASSSTRIPSNGGVFEIISFPERVHRPSLPPEYRVSYARDGTMPGRVLHLKSEDSVSYAGSMAGTDLESAASFTGSVRSYDKEAGGMEKEVATEQTAKDPNLVDWDGPEDPANPMNWTTRRKMICIALVSSITFITPLASTMFAPGVPLLMQDFHSTNVELESFVVSVFILGYVFGPLLVAPLSELYGRVPVFQVSNVLFLVFSIACAVSSDLPMFVIWRFLAGFCGVTPLTVGGGVIADIMPQEKRGGAMAIWAMGPIMAPIIGPVAGGYLSAAKGWRWIFWVISIIAGVVTFLCFIFLRETYAPTILARKAARLRKETNNPHFRSVLDNGQTPKMLFKKAIVRPAKMLFLSPIVFLLCLDVAIIYGYLYLLFTTFTYVFEEKYHFTSGQTGLTYLGLGIGSMLGLVFTGVTSDKIVKRKAAQGVMKPEYRLPLLIPGAFFIPLGLFWYGWTADKGLHWILPILGSLFIGLGLLATFMPISTYLVDAFPVYAASATAAATVLRSIFGACLPLAGQSMYAALGLGWGTSLLAFISVMFIPVPFLLIRYGERIRTHPRFQLDL